MPVTHDRATTAFVLSIIGFVLCVFCCPVAWYMGHTAGKEMDAQPGVFWANRDHARVGTMLGMIGTIFYGCILGLYALILVFSIATA